MRTSTSSRARAVAGAAALLAVTGGLAACGSDVTINHDGMNGSMPGNGNMNGQMNGNTNGPMDGSGSTMHGAMPGAGTMPGSTMMDGTGDGHMHRHDDTSAVAADARRIEVSASSFAFDPAEITATSGEDLAIVLTSTDIEHDLQIDELGAHVYVGPGATATGGFTAGAPGRYTYYCTISGHREAGMEGVLIVE